MRGSEGPSWLAAWMAGHFEWVKPGSRACCGGLSCLVVLQLGWFPEFRLPGGVYSPPGAGGGGVGGLAHTQGGVVGISVPVCGAGAVFRGRRSSEFYVKPGVMLVAGDRCCFGGVDNGHDRARGE